MLRVAVEGVTLNKLHSFNSKNESRQHTLAPFVQACSLAITEQPKIASHRIDAVKVCAARRRRIAYSRTETYVLLEPGKDEMFVTEEELKARLTYWLENWPGKALPRDLARFATIHEAVSFLVTSVCELELEGDVGSLQCEIAELGSSSMISSEDVLDSPMNDVSREEEIHSLYNSSIQADVSSNEVVEGIPRKSQPFRRRHILDGYSTEAVADVSSLGEDEQMIFI
ncbi:hypothetical protein LWI29_020701 [Acer saccharum]|uniref:Uncharacterized protein n=1 Tax=Acer saccharum TaxID=4024 RepID=A0AA39T0Y0_ACESA|nr:hypothetical protein LWI29_020701 [Acer saccharum]